MSGFTDLVPALRGERLRRGWSLQRVADGIGVVYGAVGHWEVGRRVPARANAQRWCDLLDIELPADTDGWFYREQWRRTAKCGTRAGLQRHTRRHEDPCQPCRDAGNAYAREWRRSRRQPVPAS